MAPLVITSPVERISTPRSAAPAKRSDGKIASFAGGADRGVEMRSTGEVMTSGATPVAAYRRALQAAGRARPTAGIGEPLQAA